MTQERFLKLLDNPDLLASISYEELKTLALAYPYAHTLRYLLAIKSRQDNHPEFARNLSAAAAHSLDRTRLFQLIAPKKLAPVPVEAEESVLELKPIETVQQELQARAPVPRASETASATSSAAQQAPAPDSGRPQTNVALDLTGAFGAEETEELPVVLEKAAAPEPEAAEITEKPVLDFRPSFAAWASQFNSPVLGAWEKSESTFNTFPPAKQPVKTPPPPKQAAEEQPEQDSDTPTPQMLAEKSVTENKDILSETLARLYVRQGFRDKAIAMYKRLGLAFPEKSAYFAAEIEKLKK